MKNNMRITSIILIGLVIISLAITGCAQQTTTEETTNQQPQITTIDNSQEEKNQEMEEPAEGAAEEQLIGGQRDEYGCLGPAGYSWNDTIGACVREWELDEAQREGAKAATRQLSFPVTVVGVEVLRCPGCFNVELQRNDNQEMMSIELRDWNISEE